MAQICVVNCSSCETFQGQQVKKGKKWTCKMCGEKQSFRKIFAQGSGKECRQVVQKLNMISGNLKRRMLEENCVEATAGNKTDNQETCTRIQSSYSKWNQFVSSGTSNITEIEDHDENSIESSFTTEHETYNNYVKAQKRKKPMKEIASDNLHEYLEGKIQKFDRGHDKGTYPNNRAGKSHLKDLDAESSDTSPKSILPESTVTWTITKPGSQRQTHVIEEASGPKNVSKWSKYI